MLKEKLRFVSFEMRPNKTGAGNGAGALSFHVVPPERAVPDLGRCSSAFLPSHDAGITLLVWKLAFLNLSWLLSSPKSADR